RMKTVVLCGVALLAVAPALAQTNPVPGTDQPVKTVTLTGCVGGGSDAKPITLSQAMIIPTAPQPADPTLPPPGAAATATPSPTGTSGTKSSASGTDGTTGVVSGTAPAG